MGRLVGGSLFICRWVVVHMSSFVETRKSLFVYVRCLVYVRCSCVQVVRWVGRCSSAVFYWPLGSWQWAVQLPFKSDRIARFFFFGSPLVFPYKGGTMCISHSLSVFKVDWQIHRKNVFLAAGGLTVFFSSQIVKYLCPRRARVVLNDLR